MSMYDSRNLESTLVYIKNRFGSDVFKRTGRLSAILCDLAPDLKNDRKMVDRLLQLGIIDNFLLNMNETAFVQKRVVMKAIAQLTEEEFIQSEIATKYISIFTNVFGWQIIVDIPEASIGEIMGFDSQRYMEESIEQYYSLAKKAYAAENFQNAMNFFSKSYSHGNILAGIKLGLMHWNGECSGKKDYDAALRHFNEGRKYNYPLAAAWIAEAYRKGRGVSKDKEKSFAIFQSCREALNEMCICGDADAQYMYGISLLYGVLCTKDEMQGYYWLHKAASDGHISAKIEISDCYIHGKGCRQNIEQGITLLKQLALTTSSIAHYRLGKMYLYGEYIDRDYTRALELLLYSAEREHRQSQRYVGDIYYHGYGVKIDLDNARKWYTDSSKLGDPVASSKLGDIYFYGKGIDRNIEKAFYCYKMAADAGLKYDQFMLYKLYFLKEYQEFNDYEKGRIYLKKSADQNYPPAQRELARGYLTGQIGVHDNKKFAYWIKKSADLEDAEAQRILGVSYICFEDKEIFPVNYELAIKWLKEASEKNDIGAFFVLIEIYTSKNYKDDTKAKHYMEKASSFLMNKKNEEKYAYRHKQIADIYYANGSDIETRQKAFNHYCIAYLSGIKSVLYDIAFMYYINGYRSPFLPYSSEELLDMVVDEYKRSMSANLSYLLGLMFFYGCGVDENKGIAEKWFREAIKKGSSSAACNLAGYYINEKQRNEEAYSLLKKAYEEGSVEATRLLGLCYKKGIGVKKNRSKAKLLLKEAADGGDEDAAAELKKFIF